LLLYEWEVAHEADRNLFHLLFPLFWHVLNIMTGSFSVNSLEQKC
jgi:hypothetical protein